MIGGAALPHRRRRDAVPAAAPPPGRLRHDAVPVRQHHLRRRRRRDRHEVHRAADPAPLRLPQRARLEHLRSPAPSSRCPRAFTPTTPILLIIGAPADRRLLPLAAVHQHQRARLRRRAAGADEPRDDAHQRGAAAVAVSVGISIGAIVLETTTHLTGGVIEASSFSPAFLVVGLLTLLSIVPFLMLSPDAGDEMSGRQPRAGSGDGDARARLASLLRESRWRRDKARGCRSGSPAA